MSDFTLARLLFRLASSLLDLSLWLTGATA